MNLSQLRERYSDERIFSWLKTREEAVEDRPPENPDALMRVRETLSRLRGEQEPTFVRLAASAQLQGWHSNEDADLRYLPVSPARAAHLFLAHVIRQVRIFGLFSGRWRLQLDLGDAVFLSLLEWFAGLRPTYPAAQEYWLARNQVDLFHFRARFRAGSPQVTVGPILSLFMLGYCVQEAETEVSRSASSDLVRILSSGSLLVTDEWARSAIIAGGIEVARVLARGGPAAL